MRRLERSGVEAMFGHARPAASLLIERRDKRFRLAHVRLNVLDALLVLTVYFIALLFQLACLLYESPHVAGRTDREAIRVGVHELESVAITFRTASLRRRLGAN